MESDCCSTEVSESHKFRQDETQSSNSQEQLSTKHGNDRLNTEWVVSFSFKNQSQFLKRVNVQWIPNVAF